MELKWILESILFSAQKPLNARELKEVLAGAVAFSEEPSVAALKKARLEDLDVALEELSRDCERAGRSYRLVCVAGAWQFVSLPEYAPWIKALVGHKVRAPRLSQPALETLAIIAYRQPLTRVDIEQVRGVAIDAVLATLMERGLVTQVGRADLPGRPMTYGTTVEFLEYFGLRNLEELPAADELRKVPLEKPSALLTVDPGLATSPPEQLTMPDVSQSTGSAASEVRFRARTEAASATETATGEPQTSSSPG